MRDLNDDEWGPMVPHAGTDLPPIEPGILVMMIGQDMFGGEVPQVDKHDPDTYAGWLWEKAGLTPEPGCTCGFCFGWVFPIIGYRLIKPKTKSMDIIRGLLEPTELEKFRENEKVLEPT